MDKEFKELVRIGDADIKGDKPLFYGLTKIKGVSYSLANAICNILKVNKSQKIGNLDDEDIKKIDSFIRKPSILPSWLYNRRKDLETGENKHLISYDLKLQKEFDIRRLRKIKCYRGIRHGLGLPLRGQKTRSHFRKGKTVGVKKKKGKTGRV